MLRFSLPFLGFRRLAALLDGFESVRLGQHFMRSKSRFSGARGSADADPALLNRQQGAEKVPVRRLLKNAQIQDLHRSTPQRRGLPASGWAMPQMGFFQQPVSGNATCGD
jgi:hypothetical protein